MISAPLSARPMLVLSDMVYHTARCYKCEKVKTRDEFHKKIKSKNGLQDECKQCVNIYNRNYFQSDHGRDKRSYHQKSEKTCAYRRSQTHYGVVNKRNKKKRATDPQFNMKCRLRNRLAGALKRAQAGVVPRKCARTLDLLGCSMNFYMKHIEQQFQPGMSWENQGDWHIDHIKPCAAFDFNDPEQQKACFHYSNMQPLWAMDNFKKGAKFRE